MRKDAISLSILKIDFLEQKSCQKKIYSTIFY